MEGIEEEGAEEGTTEGAEEDAITGAGQEPSGGH